MIPFTTERLLNLLYNQIDTTILFHNHKEREYVLHRALEYFAYRSVKRQQEFTLSFEPILSARVFFSVWDVNDHNHDRFKGTRSFFLVHPELIFRITNGYLQQADMIDHLNKRYENHGNLKL